MLICTIPDILFPCRHGKTGHLPKGYIDSSQFYISSSYKIISFLSINLLVDCSLLKKSLIFFDFFLGN